MDSISIEDLAARRLDSLAASEKSVAVHPEAYRETKRMLQRVIVQPLDISEYYRTAVELCMLLELLSRPESDTIFSYYSPQVDPCRNGDVRYFRALCVDLSRQMDALDRWRFRRRRLQRVK
jgi:hypothetical protein